MIDDDYNVWVLIPTALREHAPGQITKWKTAGYKVGLFVDPVSAPLCSSDLVIATKYPGVWQAWNILARSAVRLGADVCVLAGDDMDPDPTLPPGEIARQYFQKFPTGYGVMQPCGDMQGDLIDGVPNSGRICGSPWVGRDWIKLAYNGEGPVHARYWAFYADEELKLYAAQQNRLWMRPDLSQFHRHWSWKHVPKQDYHDRNQKFWEQDKHLFELRKAEGFR